MSMLSQDVQGNDHTQVTQGLQPDNHLALSLQLPPLKSQGHKSAKFMIYILVWTVNGK